MLLIALREELDILKENTLRFIESSYTSGTTLYTDISTVVFSHIVLNDGQWSVGLVLDSNDLTDPSGVIKVLITENNVEKKH